MVGTLVRGVVRYRGDTPPEPFVAGPYERIMTQRKFGAQVWGEENEEAFAYLVYIALRRSSAIAENVAFADWLETLLDYEIEDEDGQADDASGESPPPPTS